MACVVDARRDFVDEDAALPIFEELDGEDPHVFTPLEDLLDVSIRLGGRLSRRVVPDQNAVDVVVLGGRIEVDVAVLPLTATMENSSLMSTYSSTRRSPPSGVSRGRRYWPLPS